MPVRFSCEWPALGISLVRHTLDGQRILATVARTQVIFRNEHLPLAPWPRDIEPRTPNQPFAF
jgi:hypothetical protein